jgi:hypothetical protein
MPYSRVAASVRTGPPWRRKVVLPIDDPSGKLRHRNPFAIRKTIGSAVKTAKALGLTVPQSRRCGRSRWGHNSRVIARAGSAS